MRPGLWVGLVALVALIRPAPAAAQFSWRDFVVTAGVSGEGYAGNLASATVPLVDSTDHAHAAVGEFGLRGSAYLVERPTSIVLADFDLGIRQFAATGFEIRDYAPREWAGRASLVYQQLISDVGRLELGGELQGRSVDDRPPMPLFLQPAFQRLRGRAGFLTRPIQGVQLELTGDLERTDYETSRVTQVDLLDRHAWGLEVGAVWGGAWDLRFSAGVRQSEYPNQGSFDTNDPFRRDRTITVGAEWRYESTIVASASVQGIVNRSNSRRPEYDAFRVRGELGASLPWADLQVHLYGVYTGKSYIFSTPFVRLVPGEEADNASILYLTLDRPLAENLSASVRFGLLRAETDIGDSYYRRSGVSFFLNYRPRLP